MMCEIICADGLIDPFESNLIRRLSGLLYISDKDAGIIKKQVMKKRICNDLCSYRGMYQM